MVWDLTQPTDTTKIRNLGTVIRPNWQAIQEGDASFKPYSINLDNRTPLPISNDPLAIANAYLLYCKEDTAGDPQLYGIDASSNIIQFTGGAPTLGTNGHVFLPGNLMLQWFTTTAANGATVTFPIPFAANAYCVVGNEVTNNISDFDFVKPAAFTTTDFTLRLVRADGGAQTLPKTCNFIAIGQAI
jgi:hypothetical protein